MNESLDDLEALIEAPRGRVSSDLPIIVVIDDDASIRRSLTTVLKDEYVVRACADGIDGVRAVDEQVSCVILDIKMPTRDGFWVCKHLRKRNPDVPVIFHSAYQDLKDPSEVASEFRPFGYVVKGSTLSTLLALVASAVKHAERVRASRGTVEQLRQAREQLRQVPGHVGGSVKSPADAPPESRK